MKIGILVYPHYDFPPNGYGPMQEIACVLAEGLSRKGHQVTIFATADAKLSPQIKIIPTKESSLIKDRSVPDPKIYEFITLAKLLEHRNDFDILSSHIGFHILPFIEFLNYPVIINLQGDYSNPHYHHFLEMYPKANYVTISDAQRRRMPPELNFVATIHHGINIKKYSFNDFSDNYLAFLGRTSPVKGLDKAIDAARNSHHPLRIAARTDNSPEAQKYFTEQIKPQIDNNEIQWLGEQNEEEKITLLKHAKALLFPIQWEEAFGLVMIEAMACGTPVVAFDRGSVREIIKDGVTGFICPPDNIECMKKKVEEIYAMPKEKYQQMRRACRKHIEENFTLEKMADEYEKVYQTIIKEYQEK